MIHDMSQAFKSALATWCKSNDRWPLNILYYRDGVSSSQYAELEATELTQIRIAYAEFTKSVGPNRPPAPPLKLTTVIVTKRHSTRFFPCKAEDAMPKNENCCPGTLVDSVVTSPYFSDFYLQSQNGILGTARSCHYDVLTNGMGIGMKELEDFVRTGAVEGVKLANVETDSRTLPHLRPRHHGRLLRPTHLLRRPPLRARTLLHARMVQSLARDENDVG